MGVILINGSPAATSRSARLLDYVADRLTAHRIEVERLSVRDLPPAALLAADVTQPATAAALAAISRARAVVIGTPVYKAAYSGLLKSFLDLLPQFGLTDKVVLPLATGGSMAHLLALDYGLRPVLASLGAETVLTSVYAVEHQVTWSEATGLQLDTEVSARLDAATARLTTILRATSNAGRTLLADRCTA